MQACDKAGRKSDMQAPYLLGRETGSGDREAGITKRILKIHVYIIRRQQN